MDIRKHYDSFASKFMAGDGQADETGVEDQHPERSAAKYQGDSVTGPTEEHAAPQAGVSKAEQGAATETLGSGPAGTGSVQTAPDVLAEDSTDPETEPADTGPEVSGGGDPELRGKVIDAFKEIYDPEIPLNIYDLGLIYRIEIDPDNNAAIDMTLTSPNCPVAESLPIAVETAARSVEGISDVHLELVWDPAWGMDRMGEAARLELGFF